jgi:hypothetical protein
MLVSLVIALRDYAIAERGSDHTVLDRLAFRAADAAHRTQRRAHVR